MRNARRAGGRVVQLASANLLERGNLSVLGTAAAAVFGCGMYEGLLLTASTAPAAEAWTFAAAYAGENLFPSMIWSTKRAMATLPSLVCHTLASLLIRVVCHAPQRRRW
jgi:hypothetical protein